MILTTRKETHKHITNYYTWSTSPLAAEPSNIPKPWTVWIPKYKTAQLKARWLLRPCCIRFVYHNKVVTESWIGLLPAGIQLWVPFMTIHTDMLIIAEVEILFVLTGILSCPWLSCWWSYWMIGSWIYMLKYY